MPRRRPRSTVGMRAACARWVAAVWLAGAAGTAVPAAGIGLATVALEPTTLNAHVGDDRWTLVMLWTTDCVPCERQKPMLEAFHRDHEGRDARVVGVALDGLVHRDEVLAINARHATSYPVLLADEERFRRDYEALVGSPLRATPTYLLYDRVGAFVAAHAGPIARPALERVVGSR